MRNAGMRQLTRLVRGLCPWVRCMVYRLVFDRWAQGSGLGAQGSACSDDRSGMCQISNKHVLDYG